MCFMAGVALQHSSTTAQNTTALVSDLVTSQITTAITRLRQSATATPNSQATNWAADRPSAVRFDAMASSALVSAAVHEAERVARRPITTVSAMPAIPITMRS